MLWKVVLALDYGLDRQYETWIFSCHVAMLMALLGTFLSCFVMGNDFLCTGSAEVCLRSAVAEMR